jgi:hypothetical protein
LKFIVEGSGLGGLVFTIQGLEFTGHLFRV